MSVAGYELRVAGYAFRVTRYELRVLCSRFIFEFWRTQPTTRSLGFKRFYALKMRR